MTALPHPPPPHRSCPHRDDPAACPDCLRERTVALLGEVMAVLEEADPWHAIEARRLIKAWKAKPLGGAT